MPSPYQPTPSRALRFGNVVIPIFVALFAVFFVVNFFERKFAQHTLQASTSTRSAVHSHSPVASSHDKADAPPYVPTLHRRTYFYVGGSYSVLPDNKDTSVVSGQMYVEHLTPIKITRPHPIVILPGSGLTGAHFLNTPDGRPGWADYFLNKGHEIYLADLPSRGKSAWQKEIDGPQLVFDSRFIEDMFTATTGAKLWVSASLHTQWPGNGTKGDALFDAFYASIVPTIASNKELSEKTTHATVELLDKLPGPCILFTHSQSGQFGWSVADRRPGKVKGIIAVEPGGPPFVNVAFPPYDVVARPYGMTEIPIQFDPPVNPVPEHPLNTEPGPTIDGFTCTLQASPARKMKNLQGIPVLMVTAEASYHSQYDWCSAMFLKQAGIGVDHVQLKDVGMRGNGHLMFLEKNSNRIASGVVHTWLEKKGLA